MPFQEEVVRHQGNQPGAEPLLVASAFALDLRYIYRLCSPKLVQTTKGTYDRKAARDSQSSTPTRPRASHEETNRRMVAKKHIGVKTSMITMAAVWMGSSKAEDPILAVNE